MLLQLKYIPGDIYMNALAISLVEIPVNAFTGVLTHYVGLRRTLIIGACLALGGGIPLAIFSDGSSPRSADSSKVILFVFLVLLTKSGKFILMNITLLVTSTIFPAQFSGTVQGFTNFSSKVVTMGASILAEVPGRAPLIVFDGF